MGGMDAGPGTDLGALGFFAGTWVVMMAAMMLPSMGPTVSLHAQLQVRRRGGDARAASTTAATAAFLAGYLAVWAVAGLGAYALYRLGRATAGDALAWDHGGRWLAGAVLLAAAAWQLTRWKDACLARCRNPLGLLATGWRDGLPGAARMGTRAGAWCAGCCWALMASLFALGVMSLAWMALVAALVALEKLSPWPRAANLAVTLVLAALAIGVAAAPASVPGLTVPTHHGGGAMMRMEG
jgi:predicted metal-binding membrane protein